MSDDFYGVFDRACLADAFNRPRQEDYRTVFHQDRDRIMFTPTFRRLQAKTQVFQAGEYDFYRTRLTHSLEVSRIAESIAIYIGGRHPEAKIDHHLLEAISLAHDIGHPPFGHAGERALHSVMKPWGGFEGNAQTLRILTRTIYSHPQSRGGMSPSRALIDGVLKYKRLYHEGDKHHFIYQDQAEILEFCFGTSALEAELGGGDPNAFRSLECRIMDLADDISYSCFDVVDGFKARFLTPDKLVSWREKQGTALEGLEQQYFDELLAMMTENKVEPKMNRVIGELIQSASLRPEQNFMSPRTRRHAFALELPEAVAVRIGLHKRLGRELIFGSGALQQIEFKGTRILQQLTGVLFENYLTSKSPAKLLPEGVHRAVDAAPSEQERARLLCDHVSGMTDAYALRSYKRLFDPDYGSISELI